MFSSFGQRVNASLTDAVHRSRVGKAGDKAVLKASGHGGQPLNDQRAGDIVATIERGFTVLHGTWSATNHWAKAAAITEYDTTGRNYIQAAPWSAAAGEVGGLAGSMGTLLAILAALTSPTHYFALALALPLVNFLDFYAENRGGYQTEIATVRGGAPDASADPLSRAAEFGALDIPTLVCASNNDTICPPDEAEAFATAAGPHVEFVNMGDQTGGPVGFDGHAVSADWPALAADFLAAHA